MTDDLVERMHACLADALERSRPEPFGSPVTVAEIYQDLVPYRTVRTQLGFDMNADYEHTLLRLLSGEGDLARLEPPEAREELRQELDSPNPNVGLFRKFAACDVWVAARETPAAPAAVRPAETEEIDADDTWAPRVAQWLEGVTSEKGIPAEADTSPAAEVPPEAGWTDEGADSELLLEEAMEVLDEMPDGPAATVAPAASPAFEREGSMAAAVPARGEAQDSDAAGGTANCAFCGSGLPTRRPVRYCPFCGADQSTQPCVACGEPIEAGWRFCIACGSAAPETAPV